MAPQISTTLKEKKTNIPGFVVKDTRIYSVIWGIKMFDFRGMMFDVQASAKEFLFLSDY